MKYDLIDEKITGDNIVRADAKGHVSRAALLDYEARRKELLADGNPAMLDEVTDAKDEADEAMAEADAFAKAAKLSRDEVGRIQRDALREQISNLESQHLAHSRRRQVRQSAGLVVPDSDDTISRLERCKDLAVEMIKETGGTMELLKAEANEANADNRPARRAAQRSVKKASGAKKAASK